MAERHKIGMVRHFYGKIGVAAVDLSGGLSVGDKIEIETSEGPVVQTVQSMQVEHKGISKAKAGDSIGLKVAGKVRDGDPVFKVVE